MPVSRAIVMLIINLQTMKIDYIQPESEALDVLVETPILSALEGPKFQGEQYGDSEADDDNWN